MKITIISAYTWKNKGDAAILLGTIQELKEYYNTKNIKVSFNILSFTPEIDEENYKKIIPEIDKVKSNLFNPYPLKKNKINKLKAILMMAKQLLLMNIYFKLDRKKFTKMYEGFQLCSESDLIIVCGGGFLGGNKYNSLMHLAQLKFINKLDTKKILWGTSIEPPTRKLLKRLTEKTLKELDFIVPREKITEDYLYEWYDEERIVSSPDMAFKISYEKSECIDIIYKKIKDIAGNRKIIGITMRDWNFPKSDDSEIDKKKYELSMIDLMNKKYDEYLFVFVPQVIMDGDDDRIFANKIKNKLDKDNFVVLNEDFSPLELKYLISLFDQFLGTRMHSNIFSISMLLPPVAIAYEKKTNGIMEKVNLSEYVVDIEEVTTEILVELLDKNSNNFKYLNKKLEEKMNDIIRDIRDTTIKILE